MPNYLGRSRTSRSPPLRFRGVRQYASVLYSIFLSIYKTKSIIKAIHLISLKKTMIDHVLLNIVTFCSGLVSVPLGYLLGELCLR